jgi:photosystem II stability/assembly factor-like uncharacterized protein
MNRVKTVMALLTGPVLAILVLPVFVLAQGNDSIATPSFGPTLHDEGTAIRQRGPAYRRRHGLEGKVDLNERLQRVRAEYERRRDEILRPKPAAVPGTTFVSLGPTNLAGRISAIAPHPTTIGTVYLGAADGGLWKTTNGGVSWTPLTDFINDLSVGAVAVAPSSPNVIYLGTGEGDAGDTPPGIGLLKSTDGGATWLFPTSVITSGFLSISVNPANPLDLLVGTADGGGLRSTDGGSTWVQVISAPGFITWNIVRNPANSQVLWCSTQDSSSYQSVIQKSTDGGSTWVTQTAGIPPLFDRIALAVTPSNSSILYAATDEYPYSHIFKSTDAGTSWTDLPGVYQSSDFQVGQYLGGQGFYDNTIVVSPTNANTIIAGGVGYIRSTDGGGTWSAIAPTYSVSVHVDAHDLRYQGSTLYIACDGGLWSSTDDFSSVVDRNTGLVTYQFYFIANDPADPMRLFGGTQDQGVNRRPSTGGTSWQPLLTGDGFECAVNPDIPSVFYARDQGNVYRTLFSGVTAPGFSDVTPPEWANGLVLDRASSSTLYVASSSRLWRSTDGGDSWNPLPTTTTDGSTWGGGFNAIDALGPRVLAGSVGAIFRSSDSGTTWASSAVAGWANSLVIDYRNPGKVYLALADESPSVYRSTDWGATWTAASNGLPAFSAQVIRMDPTDAVTVYCGTDVGLYRSTDQGMSWAPFGAGLPNSSVNDLQISADGQRLRVGTHGRGAWELQVPSNGNNPPTAVITSPTGGQTVAQGTTLTFQGVVSDPDMGDSVTGLWSFPDTWQSISAPAGNSSAAHTFNRIGRFPATLTAIDSHGARGSTYVPVFVPEQADNCATPIVIPGSGPFPWSVSLESGGASTQTSDPLAPCWPYSFDSTFWFSFTPAASGTYEFSFCDPDAASIGASASLWQGAACGGYTAVSGGCAAFPLTIGQPCSFVPDLTVTLTQGITYRLMLQWFSGAGEGLVHLSVCRPLTPTVSSISIDHGPETGGTSVTITGTNFDTYTSVTFGGVVVPSVTVSSSNQIVATTPAHAPGTVDVAVINPCGHEASLPGAFSYCIVNPVIQGGFPGCANAFGWAYIENAGAGSSYTWTLTNGTVTSGQGTSYIAFTTGSAGQVSLSVAEQGPSTCSASASLTFAVAPGLSDTTVALQGSSSVCPGGSAGTITVTDTGGGTVSHQWAYHDSIGGLVPIPNQTDVSYLISASDFAAPGSYDVFCQSTPECGGVWWSISIPVTVETAPASPVASNSGPVALGQSLTLSASTVPGAASYRWTGPNGFASAQQNPVISSVTASDAGQYTVVAVGADGCSSSSAATYVQVTGVNAAIEFYTIAPCRLIDTRRTIGTYGGPALQGNGAQRSFPIDGQCGVPSGAAAISANVTVVGPSSRADLRIFPTGTPTPTVSSINFNAGRTRANNAILSMVGTPVGSITVQCDIPNGTTNMLLDINGYFAP